MKRVSPIITTFARKLRREQTDAEKRLWYHLRNRAFTSTKFRRQHSIGNYIVDFVSIEKKIIIEIDGGQHNAEAMKEKDETRSQFLREKGYTVLRYWNNDILQNIEGVTTDIKLKLQVL